MHRVARSGVVIAIGMFMGLPGCGAPPTVVKTALHGDLRALKREVAASRKAGTLDASAVTQLARAVARREVRSARGPDAADAVLGLGGCADSLADVLEERASHYDAGGAAAMLLLIDIGRRDPTPEGRAYPEGTDRAWRAVDARGTIAPRYGALRRSLLRDPDQLVRRVALDAALAAVDPADTEELLEVVRLDPDPLCRSKAARALGAIGGTRAVLGLKDRFAASDETLQASIADGWAMPRAFASGGERELTLVVETERGLPLLTAALALARVGKGSSSELGSGALARIIAEGTESERIAAVSSAPLGSARVRAAISKASADSDSDVRVAALARLASSTSDRARAVAELHRLIQSKDSAREAAALALADLHDDAAAPVLDANLGDRSSARRRRAALALLELTRYSSVATALADDDPGVRASVACSVLAKTR